eukprot:scaffold8886_cov125-Isochrysis_galbana.AAC.11
MPCAHSYRDAPEKTISDRGGSHSVASFTESLASSSPHVWPTPWPGRLWSTRGPLAPPPAPAAASPAAPDPPWAQTIREKRMAQPEPSDNAAMPSSNAEWVSMCEAMPMPGKYSFTVTWSAASRHGSDPQPSTRSASARSQSGRVGAPPSRSYDLEP